MKKTRLILITTTGLLSYLVVTGWSTGPAHSGTLLNGTPGVSSSGTCKNCHTGTSSGITTISSAKFTDDANSVVVTDGKYKPGHIYTVEVSSTGTGNQGFYGFQVSFMKGSNSNAGSVTATLANTGVATADGYSVIEHTGKMIATTPGVYKPTFKWTAPAAGSGNVMMHAIVNAVDGNNAISGDAVSAPFMVTLAETMPNAVPAVAPSSAAISIFPNPAQQTLHIRFNQAVTGELMVLNATGSMMLQQAINSKTTEADLSIAHLPAGIYYLQQTGSDGRSGASFIKQ